MIRGTTPTFKLQIDDNNIDFTTADHVYATFKQTNYMGNVSISKTGAYLTVSANEVDVYLTQAETLQFSKGKLQVQLNWTKSGSRSATQIAEIDVEENLEGGVLA